MLKKLLIFLLLSFLLLSSCSLLKKKVVINDISAIREIKENEYLWLYSEESELKHKYKVNNNDNIYFINDKFHLNVHLNEPLEKSNLMTFINVTPNISIDFNLKNANELVIKPNEWKIGDKATIEITANKKVVLNLEKVKETIVVSNKIISPTIRESLDYCGIGSSSVYLASGSTMLIQFSADVNKNSVNNSLDEQFKNQGFSVKYDFIDSKTLKLTFTNNGEKDSNVGFTLSNALDARGCHISDNDSYIFTLKNKGYISKYNVESLSEEVLFDLKVVDDAVVSKDGFVIIAKDFARKNINNGDVPNTTSYQSFLNIYNSITKHYKHIDGIKKVGLTQPKNLIICSNYFYYSDSIYDFNGKIVHNFNEYIRSVNTTLSKNNIAIIHFNKTDKNDKIPVVLSIFDIAKQKFENNYILGYYDRNIGEELFYFRNYRFQFISNTKVIYEFHDLTSNNKEIRVMDLAKNKSTKFSDGKFISYNPVSPDGKYVILEDSSIVKIIRLHDKEEIYSFPKRMLINNVVWYDDGSFYFNYSNDNIHLLNLNDKTVRETTFVGKPISFINSNNLVVIK